MEELHPGDHRVGPASARGGGTTSGRAPRADGHASVAVRSPVDALAQAALTTIRDVTNEVARLAREAATRATDGTPIAPLVRTLLGSNGTGPYGDRHAADTPTWSALTNAETALAVAVQRATELEERLDRAIANLRETRDREQALQAELAATLERNAAEREAVSRRSEQLAIDAEQQRATAVREAEAARAALAELQQTSLAQRNELSLARSEVARITASAEEAQQARERLEVDVRALRTRLGESQDRMRAAEVEIARLTEAHRRLERSSQTENANREARWEDQVASLRLEHTRERDRAQALTEELERQRIESRAREKREQRLQEELRAISTLADTDREETVRRAQEMVQAAEDARVAMAAELEALRASISSDRARLEQARAEQQRVEQGVAQREAALANAHGSVAQLESSRANAAAELERTRTRLSETETELLTLQHEHRLAQRQLDKLCTSHDDLVEDHARVSAFLAEARTTETTLRKQLDELRDQIRTLESERLRLRESERTHTNTVVATNDASERATTLERELQSLRRWGRMLEDEVAQAMLSLEQGAVRERRLQDALAAGEQSMTVHDETLRQAQALAERAEQERAAAVVEIEALRTAMASAQRVIMEAEEDTRVARAEAERLAVAHEAVITQNERAETPAPKAAPEVKRPAAAAPRPVAAPPDTRLVAILDAGGDWVATGGAEIVVVKPDEDVVARFGEIEAGRCVVNLAASGTIAAAAALRAAGAPIALWGTIFAAEGDRGLSLGQIEVLNRPIDADLVRSRCVMIAPKGARILAIGSDSSTFIGLRQGLMKAGMSVSIAWDLKQATELMEIVRPHMIVLDLALPSRGAATLVTQLARIETPPVLVLLPGTPDQLAAFAAAAVKLVPAEGARTHANVLRAIVETKRE